MGDNYKDVCRCARAAPPHRSSLSSVCGRFPLSSQPSCPADLRTYVDHMRRSIILQSVRARSVTCDQPRRNTISKIARIRRPAARKKRWGDRETARQRGSGGGQFWGGVESSTQSGCLEWVDDVAVSMVNSRSRQNHRNEKENKDNRQSPVGLLGCVLSLALTRHVPDCVM